jgi:hypothetical protein
VRELPGKPPLNSQLIIYHNWKYGGA